MPCKVRGNAVLLLDGLLLLFPPGPPDALRGHRKENQAQADGWLSGLTSSTAAPCTCTVPQLVTKISNAEYLVESSDRMGPAAPLCRCRLPDLWRAVRMAETPDLQHAPHLRRPLGGRLRGPVSGCSGVFAGRWRGRSSMSSIQAATVSAPASTGSVPSTAQNRRWSLTARPPVRVDRVGSPTGVRHELQPPSGQLMFRRLGNLPHGMGAMTAGQ